MRVNKRIDIAAWGPGLLFAATSVGVSHLVQSTRAGAMYGLALFLVVILANVLKYPAFRFGSDYTVATGLSLLEGYRRQGKWTLIFFGITSCLAGFFAITALSLLTAGLTKAAFGLTINTIGLAASVVITIAVILIVGHYAMLERITKILVIIISLSTVIAAMMVIPDIKWGSASLVSLGDVDARDLLFIAALIGIMPSPIDASVWQSLWVCANSRNAGRALKNRDVRQGFNVGYVACSVLALCFLLLGAGLMHSRGISVESSAGAFSAQLIRLYTDVLGEWTFPLIVVGAISIMFSTLLAVMDAAPRSLAVLIERLRSEESADIAHQSKINKSHYFGAIGLYVGGAFVIYAVYLDSLLQLIDISASITFTSAPVLAYLNHRCIQSNEMPAHLRPSSLLMTYSALSIAIMAIFAAIYIYIRFVIL